MEKIKREQCWKFLKRMPQKLNPVKSEVVLDLEKDTDGWRSDLQPIDREIQNDDDGGAPREKAAVIFFHVGKAAPTSTDWDWN